MSAPAIDRRPLTGTAPAREGAPRRTGTLAPPRIPAQRSAPRSAPRGAPRDDRPARPSAARRAERSQMHAGRAKFVLVVMTLLVCGLVATLWLSTAAAADSYRLQEARTRAGSLTEQSEQLRKQVTAMNSPASLAERATAQGLVPVQDPARLVVAPDGRVDLVGEPVAARGDGPVPPAVPGTPAVPVVPGTPANGAPAAGAPSNAAAGAPVDTGDPAAASGATAAGTSGPADGRG